MHNLDYLWKFIRVQRSTGYEEFQIWSKPSNVFDKSKQNVGVERPLVSFIDNQSSSKFKKIMQNKMQLCIQIWQKYMEQHSSFLLLSTF